MENIAAYPVIMLAAGASSRMGIPKGLLQINGEPWIRCQLRKVLSLDCVSEVIVVLGYYSSEYLNVLMTWKEMNGSTLAVINENPERGSFSSLKTGIEHLLQTINSERAFMLPLDVPCPEPNTWREIVVVANTVRTCQAVTPVYKDHGGHPVCLSSEFMHSLASVDIASADARLDRQITAIGEGAKRVAVDDPFVSFNINTQEDWSRFLKLANVGAE